MTTDKGQQAFEQLIGGGGYSSLTADGKRAFIAFATIDHEVAAARGLVTKTVREKHEGAKRAALDAVRDARAIGIFNERLP